MERVGPRYRVTTTSGRRFAADEVVVAAGFVPPAPGAKCRARLGPRDIAVDAGTLQTSVPRIHALGDCISINGQCSRYRTGIARQARTLAAAILDQPAAYEHRAAVVRVKTTSRPSDPGIEAASAQAAAPPGRYRKKFCISCIQTAFSWVVPPAAQLAAVLSTHRPERKRHDHPHVPHLPPAPLTGRRCRRRAVERLRLDVVAFQPRIRRTACPTASRYRRQQGGNGNRAWARSPRMPRQANMPGQTEWVSSVGARPC